MKLKKYKIKHVRIKRVILLLACIGSMNSLYSQEKNSNIDLTQNGKVFLKTNAEKDWEHLDHMKNFFCIPTECDSIENSSFLVYLKYVDNLYTNRSQLAEVFLDNYPNDPHYDEALNLFLSDYFSPTFINEKMTKSQIQFLSEHPAKSPKKIWFQARRILPIDKQAKKRWLKKGNDYVANILASKTSIERKAKAVILLFNRDYNLARNLYSYLPKNSLESDYWMSFEAQYWELFRLRLNALLDTYPESEKLARYIQAVLDDIKSFSPTLYKACTEAFLIKSKHDRSISNRKGIKLLHKTLKDNLYAINNLKHTSTETPLEMKFTTMNGATINLADMRGKVILIDFWSTSCGPCIIAMPHLRKLYDKYKSQGFEILGIANNGDSAREQILKILKRTGANWPQRLDKGKGATVSFHSLYKIKSLPTLWLIDAEGRIVDKAVKRNELEPLVRKYLNLKNTKS